MAESPENPDLGRQSNRRRRYFLDDSSQSSLLGHVLGILAGTGLAAGLTAYVISQVDVLGGKSLAEALPVLLAAQAGCLVLAGVVTIPLILRLTHRFVGPALVMRRALEGMRHGDYGCRLNLRRSDYLRGLAHEIEAHRTEIARRDVTHVRLMQGIKLALEDGDLDAARSLLRVHAGRLTLEPSDTRAHDTAAA